MEEFTTVVVGGVETSRLSREQMVRLMVDDCIAARSKISGCKLIFDLNGHGIALARWDSKFRNDLVQGDIIHADGEAVVMASRLLTRFPIAERSATTDFFHDAAAAAPQAKLRFFLLGSTEDVNERCDGTMRKLYPDLDIAGRRNGYFDEKQEEAICDAINALNVDVLWVGLGKPREQAFCTRNKHRLKVGWVVTCGGCFNYVAGEYARAPAWMRSTGLEWLHRMATGPRHLLWRYITTNPVAFYLLLTRTRATAGGTAP